MILRARATWKVGICHDVPEVANPHDLKDRSYYNAEMRPVVRGLLDLSLPLLQEIRALATSPTLNIAEKAARIERVSPGIGGDFIARYAYWLPWDDIRPGRDPDEIAQYRVLE